MRVTYIAEKPDIGKALAAYLWPEGNCHKEKGFIKNGDVTVTWAFGHILGLASPEEYGEEYKAWANYPIIPNVWKLKPTAAAVAQLNVIVVARRFCPCLAQDICQKLLPCFAA